MNEKKWAVLFKLEGIYGTDAAPVIGSDLINTGIPKFSVNNEPIERSHAMSGFGKPQTENIGKTIDIEFAMEMEADWDAPNDTVPAIGKVLRCCNFTETITTGNNITYQNNSDEDGDSATIWGYKDGILRKIVGCRGEISSVKKAGSKIELNFKFTGLYEDGYATDATFPTFTPSLSPAVIFQNGEVEIGSYAAPIIENMNWAMNNQIEIRPSANAAKGVYRIKISDAAPTCSVDPEIVALSTFNAFDLWESSSKVTITTVLKNPNTATHKCTLTMNNMQYKEVGEGSRAKNLTYELNFECGGEADVSLKFEGVAA